MPLTRWWTASFLVQLFVLPAIGLGASGCESDDTSPLTPAPTDAGGDHTAMGDAAPVDAGPLSKMNHVVVIYLENRSFDNIFNGWAGAEGISKSMVTQVGPDGMPYTTLPEYGPYPAGAGVESLEDASVPNMPFDLTAYNFHESAFTNDLLHRFYQEQYQINGGKMDSYVLWNDEAAGQSFGYWPTSTLPFPTWLQTQASSVTVCDHFFHAAFGGSFLNHFWLISARSPVYPNYPTDAGLQAQLNDAGLLEGTLDTTTVPPMMVYNSGANDGELTPDGYVVNTSYSVNEPHPSKFDMPGAKVNQLVPQQTYLTIADELDQAGVSWTWFAGGWNAALESAGIASVGTDAGSDIPDSGAPAAIGAYGFQFHHQPFTYFQNWGGTANMGGAGKSPPNGKWATNHNLKDEQDFLAAAAAGTLPAVSWVKPLYDEHAGYTTETDSENHTVALLTALTKSPNWKDTVVIVTYDENGGWVDHVAPPQTDKWGPGTRVPAIIVSPLAKGGVDSTEYDTTAILKLIEERWGLASLTTRDANQNSLAAHALSL